MRIEVDFTKKIMQISNFLRRCKPFTSGIEFAFDHIIESFNKIAEEVNEEAQQTQLNEEEKLAKIKESMVETLQAFANMRIINANQVICQEAIKQIKEDETILTFGANYSVKSVFQEAIKQEINFNVIVVGLDNDDNESVEIAQILTNAGIDCTFCQLNSLPLVARKVSKVFFGGISMMNNGYLVAKAGTATIACWAKSKMIPVVVCIESFKFSKKAVVHSLVSSELRVTEDGSKSKVNNKYDITPSKFIDMVV
jgi:translation initiation factor 2B subunit (eIF-2B alpha/beta/delta family)